MPEDIEYSVKQDDFVMEVMLEAARFLLQNIPTRKIFLDGRTFSRRYQIDRVGFEPAFAFSNGADCSGYWAARPFSP